MSIKSTIAICFWCKHFEPESMQGRDASCKAFPNGIPASIWYLEYDHREPYEGDNDIQFEKLGDFSQIVPTLRNIFTNEQLESIYNKYINILIEWRKIGLAQPPLSS